MVDINETALFELENELKTISTSTLFDFEIINVVDKFLLKTIFIKNKIDFIFHGCCL